MAIWRTQSLPWVLLRTLFPQFNSKGIADLGFVPPTILDHASKATTQVINLLNTPATNSDVFFGEPVAAFHIKCGGPINQRDAAGQKQIVRNLRAVQILTLAYWIAAIGWAFFTGGPDEAGFYFIGSSTFFAIPLTIALWAIWATTKYFRIAPGPTAFVIIGVVLAGIDIRGFIYYEHWAPLHDAQRSRERFLTTKLDWVHDEPLMTPQGPIGVRIQYRVTYGVAEPICESQVHAGDLRLIQPPSLFDSTANSVSPSISGACPAGSYDFTADFMPVFIPSFLANSSVAANAKSRCMRWRSDLPSREVVFSTEAQRLDFSMYFRGTETHQSTQNTYTLADFYKTALALGGVDCAENKK